MRRIAWFLLLLFAFAIPWEYSLDLGAPLGHIARLVGLALLLAAVPAVCETGRLRAPGPLQWLALGFFLWFCCSVLWTVDRTATLTTLRGYFQVIMVVWLVGEFAGSAEDLRALLRACVAGSWVLAVLTLANLYSPEAIAAGQIRFAATGQDPNDVARFLDLSFPLAALLWTSESRWPWRLLGAGYLPLGLVGVLLTGSRGGFLAAVAALAGSVFLLVRRDPRKVLAGTLVLPVIAAVFWLAVPHETLGRLATISQQLGGGDLNQRLNIWDSGWHAFVRAPFFGTGAGTFVAAAGLAPIDTAHNTVLSIGVTGGLVALFLAMAIVASCIWATLETRGPVRWAMATALVAWVITSLASTVEESRTTWLLLALIALAGRLAAEEPERMVACFPAGVEGSGLDAASEPLLKIDGIMG
jgi:O-antigen ligase